MRPCGTIPSCYLNHWAYYIGMSRIHADCPDSDPPDGLVAADVLLRQEPDEEEDEEEDDEEEDEDDGKEDADDDDTADDGYSEWAYS